MNDAYQVMLNGERQSFAVEYLDFEKASPQWHFTETGQAVFRIKIHGTWKPGDKGPLSMQWVDYTDEPLALQLHTRNAQNEEQLSVLKVTSGERVDLAVIDATGKVSETQSTSLWAWIVAGFEHIIPKGVDHILFILGLFLLQPKIRPLLWQTTAFTIAHSITLALAVLGVLSVSSRIVEPAIALSIAYVGIENIWVKELKPWRVSLVFCLGLLHGMGFASVMQELEIPKGSVIKPLLGFNLGVEGGQIAVLSVAFLLTFALLKKPSFRWVRLVGSVLIGIMGLYWTVDRIIG
jgi:hydrogenase/urease accessory protein HupE